MFWRVLVAVFSYSRFFVCDYLDITDDKLKFVLVGAAVVRLSLCREGLSPPLAELEICEPQLGLKLGRLVSFLAACLDYTPKPAPRSK